MEKSSCSCKSQATKGWAANTQLYFAGDDQESNSRATRTGQHAHRSSYLLPQRRLSKRTRATANLGQRPCDSLQRLEIGSSVTSQHAKGQAVDFEVIGYDNYKVAKWIEKNLDYDQLILEFYESGKPNSGWVHVSYKKDGQNRKQSLTFDGRSYQQGLNK